jgi:hypothetical protein
VIQRSVTILASAVLTGALLSACTQREPPLPIVPSTLALRPVSVAPPREQLSRVSIPALEGSIPTSTIAFGVGQVTISGLVVGPDGPVPDASVRIERFEGETSATTIVSTDANGRYKLTGVMGGQVRLQAFRLPDLAQTESVVGYASEVFTSDLQMTKLAGTRVQWAASPSRPILNEAVNLVIQVGARRVDADGVVRTGPLVGIGVTLEALGALQTPVVEARLTDDAGRVTFPMVCRTLGSTQVRVILATGEESVIEPTSACAPPPTTAPPTTIPPPTVAPPVPAPTAAPAPVPASTVAPEPDPVPTVPPVPVATPAPVPPVVPVAPIIPVESSTIPPG